MIDKVAYNNYNPIIKIITPITIAATPNSLDWCSLGAELSRTRNAPPAINITPAIFPISHNNITIYNLAEIYI